MTQPSFGAKTALCRPIDIELMAAADAGDALAAKSALARGANPGVRNETMGDTPLMMAARKQRLLAAQELLAASDGKAVNHWGQTALIVGVSHGDIADFGLMARVLLPISDPAQEDEEGFTAFLATAATGSASGILALIGVCDAKKKTPEGDSALALFVSAAQKDEDWEAAMDALLLRIDPMELNNRGETSLHAAAKMLDRGIVERLLGVCDANARDGEGRTPLMAAIESSGAEAHAFDGFDALAHGSDLSQTDAQGCTAFDRAAKSGFWAVADLVCDGAGLASLQSALRHAARFPGAASQMPRIAEAAARREAQAIEAALSKKEPPGATQSEGSPTGVAATALDAKRVARKARAL